MQIIFLKDCSVIFQPPQDSPWILFQRKKTLEKPNNIANSSLLSDNSVQLCVNCEVNSLGDEGT